MAEGKVIKMKGPMGPGLGLRSGMTGTVCAFGGGTGVIPFFDLVDMMFWRKKGG